MRFSLRTIKILLTLGVAMLVLNDVARLVFPALQNSPLTYSAGSEEEKKNDNNPTTTLFEEEVKHKDIRECACPLPPVNVVQVDAAIAHLIKDDEVRHLAYLAIFTPPPDRA